MPVNYTLPGVLLSGTHAARPAANAVANGTLYAETDTGQTYQSDGSSTWTAWGAAPQATPGIVLLEKHAAASSATLDFTASISSTYDEYLVEFIEVMPATNGAALGCRVSTDGGATWDATSGHYYNNNMYTSSGSWVHVGAGNTYVQIAHDVINAGILGVSGSVRVFPAGTSQRLFVGQVAYLPSAADRTVNLTNSDYEVGAFNAMRFLFTAGNIATGTIRVYGIAK